MNDSVIAQKWLNKLVFRLGLCVGVVLIYILLYALALLVTTGDVNPEATFSPLTCFFALITLILQILLTQACWKLADAIGHKNHISFFAILGVLGWIYALIYINWARKKIKEMGK